MALAIQSSPEADFIFNFRHLPPGPDLRKDPRPGTVTSHGSHNAQTSRNDGSVRTPQTIARYHSRQRRNKEQRWAHDEEDGRDLAASNVPLPSYSGAAARGLKRQEAFVSEATCKRRLVRAQREQIHDLSASDAELINLGILYNDEHVRGAGVTLDTIHHDSTPLYVVRQPRRRPRTTRQGQQDRAVPTTTKPSALPLELSFNELGQDAAIAAFLSGSYPNLDENMSTWLMQPDVAEIEAQGQQDDEDEATPRQNDFCFPAAPVTKTARRGGYEPSTLQIIYEAEDPESVEAEMSDAYGAEDDTQVPDEDEFEYDWASVSGASLSSSQVELDFENDEGEEIKGAGRVTLVGEKKIGGGETGAHRRVDAWVVLAGDS